MIAPWTTVGISTPARLAPQTMMVTSAAARAAAVTFGLICIVTPYSRFVSTALMIPVSAAIPAIYASVTLRVIVR